MTLGDVLAWIASETDNAALDTVRSEAYARRAALEDAATRTRFDQNLYEALLNFPVGATVRLANTGYKTLDGQKATVESYASYEGYAMAHAVVKLHSGSGPKRYRDYYKLDPGYVRVIAHNNGDSYYENQLEAA
jgi:hypothetical protein